MKDKLELDPRILEKNLEITKVLADNTTLRSELVDLKERMKSPIMINTLEKCSDTLKVYFNDNSTFDYEEDYDLFKEKGDSLRKDLRKVISFLQQ